MVVKCHHISALLRKMVATQVNSGDSGAGDHDYCDDYYFIKSLLEFKEPSTEQWGSFE